MRVSLITGALVALDVALAAMVGIQWVLGSQHDALLSARGEVQTTSMLKLDAPQTSSDMEIVQAQALFHKSRRFYVAPAPSVVEQALPDYRLTGSMATPNRPVTAILVNNQTNARIKVTAGDQLDGWTVANVEARRVVIQSGDRSAEIAATTPARTGGLTTISNAQPQPVAVAPSSGGVRVLSGSGGMPSAPRPANSAASESVAPRLYRPPGR